MRSDIRLKEDVIGAAGAFSGCEAISDLGKRLVTLTGAPRASSQKTLLAVTLGDTFVKYTVFCVSFRLSLFSFLLTNLGYNHIILIAIIHDHSTIQAQFTRCTTRECRRNKHDS